MTFYSQNVQTEFFSKAHNLGNIHEAVQSKLSHTYTPKCTHMY